jgi:hypothetical protein
MVSACCAKAVTAGGVVASKLAIPMRERKVRRVDAPNCGLLSGIFSWSDTRTPPRNARSL